MKKIVWLGKTAKFEKKNVSKVVKSKKNSEKMEGKILELKKMAKSH